MNQEIRQEIVTLARELPDDLLPEALASLKSIAKKDRGLDRKSKSYLSTNYTDLLHQKLPDKSQETNSDNSSTFDQPEFDKTIAAYQVISEKYKNALRELA